MGRCFVARPREKLLRMTDMSLGRTGHWAAARRLCLAGRDRCFVARPREKLLSMTDMSIAGPRHDGSSSERPCWHQRTYESCFSGAPVPWGPREESPNTAIEDVPSPILDRTPQRDCTELIPRNDRSFPHATAHSLKRPLVPVARVSALSAPRSIPRGRCPGSPGRLGGAPPGAPGHPSATVAR